MQNETSKKMIRLMIVDDQPLIRRGLSMMLGAESDIEVVATAEDGQHAIDLALEHSPDVIIMDLQMPGTSGVDATRKITAEKPDIRVVVLTTFDHDDLVFDAIRAGAQAYLLKDATESEVLKTVRAVDRGESYLSPTIARKVMRQFRNFEDIPPVSNETSAPESSSENKATYEDNNSQIPAVEPRPSDEPLTPREEQILNSLADGKTNKQIANEFDLAEGTVKNYVSRIMEKLHARSRTEVAIWRLTVDSRGETVASLFGNQPARALNRILNEIFSIL